MDRRSFVWTSGGILVAAAGLSACEGTDPSDTGVVVVTITGLGTGLVDGGTAVVTRTDIATQLPVSITVPESGTGQADVPAGVYHAIYTPPTGYQVSGSNEFDIEVKAFKTTPVDVTVAFIAIATQGTLRVVVTGLTASAPSGGTASMQISGQAAIVAPVPVAAGQVDTVVTAGIYAVTYTPPVGWAVANGTQNPRNVTVAASATATTTFAVNVLPVGFPTPDLLNNASFETGFDNFKNGSAGPPTGVARDTAHAVSGGADAPGQFSVTRLLPVTSGTDLSASMFWPFYAGPGPWNMPVPATNLDRIWGRFYFYFDAAITGTLKFQIFEEAGFNTQFGGFYCAAGRITWAFIQEWNSQIHPFANLSTLVGGWHSLECDYWRNGDPSGFPSVGIWLDGNQITSGIGNPPSPGSWVNGRLNAGQRGSTAKVGTYNLIGILNGTPNNTVAANVWIDRVSISSLGRIGP